jgi:hypothetical protein
MNVVPDAGVHGVSGERLKRCGADEAQCGLSRNDADDMTGFGELADHRARLVRGDASGDADDDPLAVHLWPP